MLLGNVENYAVYVGNAIVNQNIDTGNRTMIILPRTNISEPIDVVFVAYSKFPRANMLCTVVLDAMAIPQNISEIDTVYFPDLEADKEREFGNAPAQARIPANLLIERGANGSGRTFSFGALVYRKLLFAPAETNVTTVNVLFSNLELFLPPIGYINKLQHCIDNTIGVFSNETVAVSSVLSSQIIADRRKSRQFSSFPIEFYFETERVS